MLADGRVEVVDGGGQAGDRQFNTGEGEGKLGGPTDLKARVRRPRFLLAARLCRVCQSVSLGNIQGRCREEQGRCREECYLWFL